MPQYNKDADRQVVPRWRTLTEAKQFGELTPLSEYHKNKFHKRLMSDVLADWKLNPSVSVASEVCASAITLGHSEVAHDAANYVIASPTSTSAARDIAQRCLSNLNEPSETFNQLHGSSGQLHQVKKKVRTCRERLRQYPHNPVLWINLALAYTILGHGQKSKRAIEVALSMAPNSRFVTRSASRFFLHEGDLDRAEAVLTGACVGANSDPWILASQIAVTSVQNKSSHLYSVARRFLDSDRFAPFHLSELASALSTMEAKAGNVKKSRKLCRRSIKDPAENAIAQAAWLDRRFHGMSVDSTPMHLVSAEADAWINHQAGSWDNALVDAKLWQDQQQFSSRPAILAGYISSTVFEDFEDAVRILERARPCNNNDALLHNNLAFAQIELLNLSEAERLLQLAKKMPQTISTKICLAATTGILSFRSGAYLKGRQEYQNAMMLAKANNQMELFNRAMVYYTMEEIRAQTEKANDSWSEGIAAAQLISGPMSTVLTDRLTQQREKS